MARIGKVTRLFSLLLAVLMFSSVLGFSTLAFAEAESDSSAETQWSYQSDTSPVDITNFFRARWWDGVVDEGSGWEDSAPFNEIKEKTGVSLHYEVPAASESEFMATMIAAGTYPDMVTFSSFQSPYIAQMKEAGLIYSITELANEYAPKLFSEDLIVPTMRAFHNDENGELWYTVGFLGDDSSVQAYIDSGYVPTGGDNIMYVRKDILAAYGKEDITTWEDLNTFLRFVQSDYPDVYPIQPSIGGTWLVDVIGRHYLAKFGAHLSNTYVNVADQKLEYILKDPACKNYIGWLNELYRDNVLTDALLTIDSDTNSENSYAGKYAMMISSTFTAANHINTTIIENDGNEDRIYVPISNVLYDEAIGFQVQEIKDKGSSATVITKNCQNPDRAIRLVEYFLTEEGQVNGTLGVEGVTWEWKDGQRVLLPEPAELIASNLLSYVQEYKVLGTFTQFVHQKYWAQYCDNFLTPQGELRDLHNRQLGPYLTDIWNYGFVDITRSFLTGTDEEIVKTRIDEATRNGLAKVIASKSAEEFDTQYDELIAELESLDLATIEKVYTDAYLHYCENLGITPFEKLFESKPLSFE